MFGICKSASTSKRRAKLVQKNETTDRIRDFLSSLKVLQDSQIKGGEFKQLWDSEEIPSNDKGGLSSVVVAGDRAYLSVVWHKEEPSETRQINELVVRQLGVEQPAVEVSKEEVGVARQGGGVIVDRRRLVAGPRPGVTQVEVPPGELGP